jgi:hypothetical protein
MKVCVQTQIVVRRVQRHPVVRHVSKHIVKGTALGVVPGTLNDVVFHNAPFDFNELVHATQDSFAISVLNTIALYLKASVL